MDPIYTESLTPPKALLDMKKQLTIEDIAKRLKTTPEIVRRYMLRYGL